jgi:hypothetical protein
MQTWCDIECAIAIVRAKKEKEYNAETKRRKKALTDSDRDYWIVKTQKIFNKWIRFRDQGKPCPSCGCPDGKGKRNACHYRPAGVNTALRFDERNVHGGCERCNTYMGGNLIGYRAGLVERIGEEEVQSLDDNHDIKRWTIDELKEIHREYSKRLRDGI